MWDWLNLRRRSRRRTPATRTNEQATAQHNPETPWCRSSIFHTRDSCGRDFMNPIDVQPKCLMRLPCSDILYGDRMEDFSPDCWLENHLHRFGGLSSQEECNDSPLTHDDDDSITGSHDNTTLESIDMQMFDIDNTQPDQPAPRLALEELFLPSEVESISDIPVGYRQIVEPPPYTQFQEQPPTYEEAVGRREENYSISTRSSRSSDLTFLW